MVGPRALLQLTLSQPGDVWPLPDVAILVATCKVLPLAFVDATEDSIDDLRALPIVIAVEACEALAADLARGIDRMLCFNMEHAASPEPNGWSQRVDHTQNDGVPRRPVFDPGEQLIQFDDVVEPTLPFVLSSVVLSKEPPEFSLAGAADPVGVATLAASAFGISTSTPSSLDEIAVALSQRGPVVVVAAGNHGRESLSTWAALDWTLAAGATTDDSGTALADYSASGAPGGPSGPDLVADGRSAVDASRVGTSFAAPNVARQVATMWAFAETVKGHAVRWLTGESVGVPLSCIGIVDDGQHPWEQLQLPRYPWMGVRRANVEKACELLREHGLTIAPEVTGRFVRGLVLASAVPPPDDDPGWGAGFVSDATTVSRIQQLTAADVATLLCPAMQERPRDLLNQLSALPLGDECVPQACEVWRRGMVVLLVDENTQFVSIN